MGTGEGDDPSRSTRAYDHADRLTRYDSDMAIMHPLRTKMISIALEFLPLDPLVQAVALDLGVGTGLFTQRFLDSFRNASVVAVDGAASMLRLAASRLEGQADRIEWLLADFRHLPETAVAADSYDVVFSSYALHHLDAKEKETLLRKIVGTLKPGGWFVNADLVVSGSACLEKRIQEIRVSSVTARAPHGDLRFQDEVRTRKTLDDLEAEEQDQPLSLDDDLRILRRSGLRDVDVVWKEYREVVLCGMKADQIEGETDVDGAG